MNDFIIFTIVTIASLTAGSLQHHYGWQTVNLGVIPLLVIILASIVWLRVTACQDDLCSEEQIQEVLQEHEV